MIVQTLYQTSWLMHVLLAYAYPKQLASATYKEMKPTCLLYNAYRFAPAWETYCRRNRFAVVWMSLLNMSIQSPQCFFTPVDKKPTVASILSRTIRSLHRQKLAKTRPRSLFFVEIVTGSIDFLYSRNIPYPLRSTIHRYDPLYDTMYASFVSTNNCALCESEDIGLCTGLGRLWAITSVN